MALLSVVLVLGMFPTMGVGIASVAASPSLTTVDLVSGMTAPVKVVQIAAGRNNSIALKSDGTVIAWGDNIDTWAKPPEGLKDVVEIYAKNTAFLARKSNGTIVAWGSNDVGETNVPAGLYNVISVATAGHHTMAVAESSIISGAGEVIAWGLNGDGQAVVPAAAKSGVKKVAAGTYYSMALKLSGTVVDWGSNGPGATSMPAGLSGVVDIDAGSLYALALKSDGTVVAWGQEYNGNRILDVAGLTDVVDISANSTHALALKRNGTVVGWGDDYRGKATPPVGLKDVVAVSAGVEHSLALKSDGTVVSWGSQTSVPGSNKLSALTIAEGAPDTAFKPSDTSYHYDIAPEASSVHIQATLQDAAYSALYINDQLQTSGSTVTVPVPATGTEIKVRVEPYMNVKASQTYTLTISRDRAAPVIDISPSGGGAPVRSINTLVTITDATSGLNEAALEYVWSQAASAPVGGWTRLSLLDSRYANLTHTGVDGNWYLYVRGEDNAGNGANASAGPYLIDNTAPVVNMTVETADGNGYTSGDWTNQDVKVTAEASDAHTAIALFRYSLDAGQTWTEFTADSGSFSLTVSGTYTVIVQASDTIGNVKAANCIVNISKGVPKLTPTMSKLKPDGSDGDPYTGGDWTNQSVRVGLSAEPATQPIDRVEWSLNGVDVLDYFINSMGYSITTVIPTDGINVIEFKVFVVGTADSVLTVSLPINVDKTKPTVAFSPNGNSTSERDTSVTASVYDNLSGLVESTLEYVWTQEPTDIPSDGWQPLNNHGILTLAGVTGEWYLRVRGKDMAGNEVNERSNAFEMNHSELNSTISPNTGSFDKNATKQADVMTMLSLKGNTLDAIRNGSDALTPDEDYTVAGNTAIINKSYLAAQPVGSTSLTFDFSGGADETLTIAVEDTTVVEPPEIVGPTTMLLTEGYSATSTVSYAITGTAPVTVSKTAGDSKITWNGTTKTLDIATGLTEGSYPVTLTASNGVAADAELHFTLTVQAAAPGGTDPDDSASGGNSDDPGTPVAGGSGTANSVISIDKQLHMPTVATMNVPGTVKDGVLSATITEQMVKDTIKAAQDAARKSGETADGIAVAFSVTSNDSYSDLNILLEPEAIDRLEEAGVRYVRIGSNVLDLTFDTHAIVEMNEQSNGAVTVSAGAQTKLSAAAKRLIGARPVFNILVGYRKDDRVEYVTNFGKGVVVLGIAYDAADEEKPANLIGVYVDSNGNPQLLDDSSYDDGRLSFSRSSLSTYGVGYKVSAPAFTDTVKHWAKISIDFVAGRNLISGTSATTFAPDIAITRADFLMALGRLSGADVSGYRAGSFTDVEAGDPAMPYIEWAVKQGIVQGIGGGMFGPALFSTRQDMAVMMQNYVKATGYKMPVSVATVAFSDDAKIAAYAKGAVTAIQQAGIMRGKGDNLFDPQGNATRAEASTILRLFAELVIDG